MFQPAESKPITSGYSEQQWAGSLLPACRSFGYLRLALYVIQEFLNRHDLQKTGYVVQKNGQMSVKDVD